LIVWNNREFWLFCFSFKADEEITSSPLYI